MGPLKRNLRATEDLKVRLDFNMTDVLVRKGRETQDARAQRKGPVRTQ